MTVDTGLDDAAERDAAVPDFDWSIAPEGTTAWTFDAPSGGLAAWSLGDPTAERVVLVPGATGSKEDFALLAPILARAGYFVQSYDIAGQYESADAGPNPETGDWDYPLFVDDMLAFLNAGEPAHLLGFSFGGIVAQQVTVRHPELVRTLTLLATPPVTGQVFHGVRRVGALTRLYFTAAMGAWAMIWNVTHNFSRVKPQRLAFANARLKLTKKASVVGIVALMMKVPDLRAELRAAGIPILVVAGRQDLWTPARYERYARDLGAEVEIYATGHSPCETTPNQMAVAMLRLFRRGR